MILSNVEVVNIIRIISTKSKRNTKRKPVNKQKPAEFTIPDNDNNPRSDIINNAMNKALERAEKRKKANGFKSSIIKKLQKPITKLSYATIQTKIAIVGTVSFVVLGSVGALFMTVFGGTAVNSIVTIEAGEPMPHAAVFARNPGDQIRYVSDVSEIILNKVEDIDLSVLLNDIEYDVVLRVVDTIAPVAKPNNLSVAIGETPAAGEFIGEIIDATEVTVTYAEQPDFNIIGKQDVSVILEDGGNNITEYSMLLYIFDLNDGITIEAGTDVAMIPIYDFLKQNEHLDSAYENIQISFTEPFLQTQADTVGIYDVKILLRNTIFSTKINVIDTTPPTGNVMHMNLWLGQTAEPIDLVADTHDYSDFTAWFLNEPDFTLEGSQEIIVVLEDIWGNRSEFNSLLTITRNLIPPEIRGAEDQVIAIGTNILYRAGVTAWSVADGEIDFEVDASAVNNNVKGKYPVIYTAIDSGGNETSVTVTITIVELTQKTALELADTVLSDIIRPTMTETEKARAIHRWIKSNIRYSGNAEREKYRAAFNGLQNRHGDCYTYYAVSSLMLDGAGIRNIQIRRTPGARPTNHWWNLIQLNGAWYHFDACPNSFGFHGFMFTAVDAARVSAEEASHNYYAYEPALYPRIVGASEVPPPPDGGEQHDNHVDNHGDPANDPNFNPDLGPVQNPGPGHDPGHDPGIDPDG